MSRRADAQLAAAVRAAAAQHRRCPGNCYESDVFHFLRGFLSYEFPQTARALNAIADEHRTAWWPFPDGGEQA